MPVDVEEQYDKIYRYCYFKLRHQQNAEDITQETFLRYFQRYCCKREDEALKCLYTIARNLCVDTYRRQSTDSLLWAENREEIFAQEQAIDRIAVQKALSQLRQDEQELLLLRYVNEVPIAAMGAIYGISRFALRRRLLAVEKKFKKLLEGEGFT